MLFGVMFFAGVCFGLLDAALALEDLALAAVLGHDVAGVGWGLAGGWGWSGGFDGGGWQASPEQASWGWGKPPPIRTSKISAPAWM